MLKRVVWIFWRLLILAAVAAVALPIWLTTNLPTGIDRWLDVTRSPEASLAIVVLASGTTGTNLPLPRGWERLDTAAQLYAAGMAPFVIVSGGGTNQVSEAEVYARAAEWLGVPKAALVLEPTAQRTADHGPALRGLALPDGRIVSTETPLIVVTSDFHSRRALRSFTRAGFSRVRVVSHYRASKPVEGTPSAMATTVPGYRPSGRQYDDVLFRLAYRSFDFFLDLREVAAIGVEYVRSESR